MTEQEYLEKDQEIINIEQEAITQGLLEEPTEEYVIDLNTEETAIEYDKLPEGLDLGVEEPEVILEEGVE